MSVATEFEIISFHVPGADGVLRRVDGCAHPDYGRFVVGVAGSGSVNIIRITPEGERSRWDVLCHTPGLAEWEIAAEYAETTLIAARLARLLSSSEPEEVV